MARISVLVTATLVALGGLCAAWWILHPGAARPGGADRTRAAVTAPDAPAPPPAGAAEAGFIEAPPARTEPPPDPPPAAPVQPPLSAEGLTWEETLARKQAQPPTQAAASAAEADIAAVLAEPALQKITAQFSAEQRQKMEVLLDWFRRHRGSAADDAEALRRDLITAKVEAGDVTILPRGDGLEVPKPEPPPKGVRYAGWPHTVGEVSYWVTLTEDDSPAWFDLVDLGQDPQGCLRTRIARIFAAASH